MIRTADRARRRIIVLGSTGSIGCRALDVVRKFSDRLQVVGLATRTNTALLTDQVREFSPEAVAVAGASYTAPSSIPTFLGPESLVELVRAVQADIVLVATVGIAGLLPTLEAIACKADVALANKEVLVAGGELVTEAAAAAGCKLLPVDSEHNAVFQCLKGHSREDVRRIILTASGGPFRTASRETMAAASPADALRHPTWNMGNKISIDSATLMNKGFEVIEAAHLFGVPIDQIEVVIHPQSTLHSMVEFHDRSIMAHLGPSDMFLPIQHCFLYPEVSDNGLHPLDLVSCGALTFEAPDHTRFPCLNLAYQSVKKGGCAPAVVNAANEVAVQSFLDHAIGFLDIPALVGQALSAWAGPSTAPNLSDILAADAWARAYVNAALGAKATA